MNAIDTTKTHRLLRVLSALAAGTAVTLSGAAHAAAPGITAAAMPGNPGITFNLQAAPNYIKPIVKDLVAIRKVDCVQESQMLGTVLGDIGFDRDHVADVEHGLDHPGPSQAAAVRSGGSRGRRVDGRGAGEPGAGVRSGAGYRHEGPGIRHGCGLDRGGGARSRANARLHGRRSEHGHRDARSLTDPVNATSRSRRAVA